MIDSLNTLFARDLGKLESEILAYKTESNLWVVDHEIKNCAGNLALHLAGNLQHFIGTIIGKTNYVRDREFEFNGKNVPREELISRIHEAKSIVANVLSLLDPNQLDEEYPLEVFGYKMKTRLFILHLYGHLNYHLGQINYHRRLID